MKLTLNERWARALEPEYDRVGNHAYIDEMGQFTRVFMASDRSITFHIAKGTFESPPFGFLTNCSLQGAGIGKTIITQD